MDTTLNYYNENAEEFVQGTASVDFSETQDRFLSKLKVGASVNHGDKMYKNHAQKMYNQPSIKLLRVCWRSEYGAGY